MPAALRKADRRRRAGIRHRHDDVGLDRAFDAQAPRRCACARRRRCGLRPTNPAGRNRHIRRCRSAISAARTGNRLSMPLAVTTTISPGFRSRTKRAPMMSSAQVSEARIQAPSRSPSTSGRMPSGSRQPIIFFDVSATSEKAPSTWRIASMKRELRSRSLAGGDQVQDASRCRRSTRRSRPASAARAARSWRW